MWRHRVRQLIVLLLLVSTFAVSYSYGSYLTAAGSAPVSVRTVDWLREHGFASAVNAGEQWWYTRHVPTGAKVAAVDLPTQSHPRSSGYTPRVAAPDVIASVQPTPQLGEGVWQSVDGLAVPRDAAQQTFVRPDLAYPAVDVNLVRFDQRAISTTYVPGLKEPGGQAWSWSGQVPPSQRSRLVAAFNAGFKFNDTQGGVYTEGRHAVRPLQDGLASIVIRSNGKVEVDEWGRDATLTGDVASVRQNLHLIVDGARIDPGLTTDRSLRWGTARSQMQYTWRSGLGVDAKGRLLYAAGPKASLTDLATALQQAGAVRAMELDIHDQMVTFNWFRTTAAATGATTTGTKLAPSMQRDANRFLTPDQRDFIAVQRR